MANYCRAVTKSPRGTTAVIFFLGGSVLFYSNLRIFELVDGKEKLACLTHATGCTVKNTIAKIVSLQLITELLNVFFK